MINFTAKLHNALSLLEMAQLAAKHIDLHDPQITGYRLIIGKNSIQQPLPVDGTTCTRADAEAAAQHLLDTKFKGWLPETYRDSFEVNSFDELTATAKIEPQYDTSSSFNTKDRKALLNPVTWRKIEDYLNANPAGYRWAFAPIDRTKFRLKSGDMHIVDFIKQQRPGIDYDNTIFFVKMASSGDPLDADMLIHTAAHAVFDHGPNGQIFQEINDGIDSYRKTVFKAIDYGYPEDDEIIPDADAIDREKSERIEGGGGSSEDIFAMFCHFNAALNTLRQRDVTLDERTKTHAKKRSLLDRGELVHEMMSIFIKRNKVKIAPNEYCFIKSPRLIAKALQIGEYINDQLANCLDNCVGQFIVDN